MAAEAGRGASQPQSLVFLFPAAGILQEGHSPRPAGEAWCWVRSWAHPSPSALAAEGPGLTKDANCYPLHQGLWAQEDMLSPRAAAVG